MDSRNLKLRAKILLNGNSGDSIRFPIKNEIRLSLWFEGWSGTTSSIISANVIIDRFNFLYELVMTVAVNELVIANKINVEDIFYLGHLSCSFGHGIVLENLGLIERKKYGHRTTNFRPT